MINLQKVYIMTQLYNFALVEFYLSIEFEREMFLMQSQEIICNKELILADAKDIVYPKQRPKQRANSKEFIKISSSIKHNGMMEPIVVKLNEDSELEIISGEIIFDAALLAGIKQIPCILVHCDSQYGQIFSAVEEIKKGNLDMFEEARLLDKLVNGKKILKRDIAGILGWTISEVNLSLQLHKFGEEEKFIIKEEGLNKTYVSLLSAIDDFIYRRKALDEIVKKNLNFEQANSLVKKYLKQISKYRERELRKNAMPEELRLFMAGLQKAVDMVKSTGLETNVSKMESDNYIECTVRIQKRKNKQVRIA